MQRCLPFLLLLPLAACGGGGGERSDSQETRTVSQDLQTYDANADVDMRARSAPPPPPTASPEPLGRAGPGISPTAAPGVAFNYRYGFRLPAQRIGPVQEQHAQACEKLGPDRCRITGMLYRLVNESDIEAMLAFKLDPAIARTFGKQGVDAVVQAEGMLVESQITGEDAGADIAAANRSTTNLEEELAEVEKQLARPNLRSGERAELQAQAAQLRESIRAQRARVTERRESLAKTPVVFNYGSGELVPGFDEERPFAEALDKATDNIIHGFSAIMLIALSLLPWLLVALLGFLIWRAAHRALTRRLAPREPEAAPDAPAEA
jgi:hypothetical protein